MKIILYGTDTCPDCIKSKRFLDEHKIKFEYINLARNPEKYDAVLELNIKIGKGPYRSIPAIVIDEEKILSEPSNEELAKAIGIRI